MQEKFKEVDGYCEWHQQQAELKKTSSLQNASKKRSNNMQVQEWKAPRVDAGKFQISEREFALATRREEPLLKVSGVKRKMRSNSMDAAVKMEEPPRRK
mmetsp:Transcript_48865/g.35962  ORF Transcript_48865/g.35962 Transcript_48865/m.35962 type:complete len:99 (+) Transcript_48865:135-431(+)